jgi:hypothetical protein
MKRTKVKKNERILRGRRPRASARRQSCTQDRPDARDADLHLERRQSRRDETVVRSDPE